MIFAIDPGSTESGICLYSELTGKFGVNKLPNEEILERLREYKSAMLAIEMVACYGMPAGASLFDTCVWIGRFIEAHGGQHTKIFRKTVVTHICGSSKAKDSNIRKALIDRFGPPGTKKKPGRLYGVKKDMWSALAIALTFAEQNPNMLKSGV